MSSRLLQLFIFISLIISTDLKAQQFSLVDKSTVVSIVYDRKGPALDSIAAGLLAADIKMITGVNPVILHDLSSTKGNVILIGNIQSENIKKLIGNSMYDSLLGRTR